MKKFTEILIVLFLLPFWAFGETSLPAGIKWETNMDDPPLGVAQAVRGGKLRMSMTSYPATFRLIGPGSNGYFANYTGAYGSWPLAVVHPTSLNVIPVLATHWAIMDDNKTVYYKLNKKARWSDGRPITADDFVFAAEVYRSKHIQDPYANNVMEEIIERVEKVDDYTIKMVNFKTSWRILIEQSFSPLPKHYYQLSDKFVKKYQWKFESVPGPYIIKKYKHGKWVEFSRVKNWWGENEHYFKGMFNFDTIRFEVVRDRNVGLEMFKKGEFDILFVSSSKRWGKDTNFDEVKKGYVNKQRIFIETPDGAYGIWFNTKDSVMSDINIRKALSHLFNFNIINEKLMFSVYSRKHHFIDSLPPYKHPDIRAREFDVARANQLLDQAGWTSRNEEGIRMKGGKALSLVLTYGGTGLTRHLTVFKEDTLKAGIEIKLKSMDGAAAWKTFREKKHQMHVTAMTTGLYPAPREYFHTAFIKPESNNFFMFGNAELDGLIETYETSMIESERVSAIRKMEEMVFDNALWIPFFKGDFYRILWWRYLQTPPNVVHKADIGTLFKTWDSWWLSPEAREELNDFENQGKAFDLLPIDFDPYKVRR